MKAIRAAIFLLVSIALACKEPFLPAVDPYNKNLLVVECFINIGGKTTITLNRSSDLQDLKTRIPEVNAELTIEGIDGTSIKGTSLLNGQVSLSTEDLSLDNNYRLKIKTSNGNVYHKPADVVYRVAPVGCIDCRLKGSKIKPSYWPS